MRSPRFLLIIVVVALLIDLYVFQAIKTVTHGLSPRWKLTVYSLHWGFAVLAVLCFLAPIFLHFQYTRVYNYLFAIIAGLYIAKLLTVAFLLIDDIRRVIQWGIGKLSSRPGGGAVSGGELSISRSTFLSWLGMGLGTGVYSAILYGFSNKYNYRIHRVRLAFDNLPAAFKGLKIVQLSDIHTGSLNNLAAVNRGIDMVLAQKPDLILFTGDVVNNIATELTADYQAVFSRLKAPMGVFSTLGNHDYGDYLWWETAELKKANLDRLKQIEKEMGWRLLMNEHVALERGGEQIALIGIENWSAKARFPKYGRMDLAYRGAEKYPFKLLMSHDPSHWDAEIRPHYPDIDLMLSGHTHGMQFGVELPGFKWSPVQFLYKQWAGLYTQGRQQLYVNRGYGFIGYPGRFGILPEITVIELV
ncbi:MAG TPA: metallophosphoesterase [Puia sp.]|jgi:predicted MPP superfamily phosphohydrolase|nr:metallophosphoesterase [Puia sp.]